VETINRVIDVFPPHQQQQIRTQLSFVLEGVLAQQLIPKIGGKGRVLAMEVMIPNPAIRNLIREDKIQQIYSSMQVGQSKFGMQTMNQALLSLLERHLISVEDAMLRSHNLDEFKQMLSTSNPSTGRRERPVKTA
jgi:twitching motility protein PilT